MVVAESPSAKVLYSSDQSLLLEFGPPHQPETRQRVVEAARRLQSASIPGLVNLHPAYGTVLVVFDPVAADPLELARQLLDAVSGPPRQGESELAGTLVEIPVRYGGESGPDLDWVAGFHGTTPAAIVDRHASVDYEVCFLGFAPGFAYLSGLPDSLVTPRLDSPRKLVPAGSVGIAGAQTGVYPAASPGGWRLIGRTDVRMFDPSRNPMSLLAPGDRVRFLPL
jgi:KipI family sensor histidine kinase inhibitor